MKSRIGRVMSARPIFSRRSRSVMIPASRSPSTTSTQPIRCSRMTSIISATVAVGGSVTGGRGLRYRMGSRIMCWSRTRLVLSDVRSVRRSMSSSIHSSMTSLRYPGDPRISCRSLRRRQRACQGTTDPTAGPGAGTTRARTLAVCRRSSSPPATSPRSLSRSSRSSTSKIGERTCVRKPSRLAR